MKHPTTIVRFERDGQFVEEVELELRPHGRYKPLHWFTIGIWMYVARLFSKRFAATYADGLNAVSLDGTVYYVKGFPPPDETIVHEAFHVHQWHRDGVWGLLKRTLTMYNIYAEAEASAAADTPLAVCVDKLTGGAYWMPPWWTRKFVLAVASVAYAETEQL